MTGPRFGERAFERYRQRARLHGPTFGAVEYSLPEGQECRFEAVLRLVAAGGWPAPGLTVLDLGCGLGDFRRFLLGRGVPLARYVGFDVVPEMVEHARQLDPAGDFRCGSVFDVDDGFDAVVAIGIFTVREATAETNRRLALSTLSRMFALCRRTACVTLLSGRKATIRADEYVVDPWDFAHEVQEHVGERVAVDHQEMPHEVFVAVYRGPSRWKRAYDARREAGGR